MSWVCANCSTANADAQSTCMVCGTDRPCTTGARTTATVTGAKEGKVLFSDFDAFKESLKSFFSIFSRKKAKKEKPPRKAKAPAELSTATLSGKDKTTPAATPSKKTAGGFAEPWPEHAIAFDKAAIQAKGYVRSQRDTLGGVKGYTFCREDGSTQFLRMEMALIQKMAYKV